MTISAFRAAILRALYDELKDKPKDTTTLLELQARRSLGWEPSWPDIVLNELEKKGLIESPNTVPPFHENTSIRLTGDGFYEAEKSLTSPPVPSLYSKLMSYQGLGLLIGVIGIVAAISYPEFRRYLDNRKVNYDRCVTMPTTKALASHRQDGEFISEYVYNRDFAKDCNRLGFDYDDRVRYQQENDIRDPAEGLDEAFLSGDFLRYQRDCNIGSLEGRFGPRRNHEKDRRNFYVSVPQEALSTFGRSGVEEGLKCLNTRMKWDMLRVVAPEYGMTEH